MEGTQISQHVCAVRSQYYLPAGSLSSHPTRIRQWFNEQQHTALLPADLSDIQAESIETIELDERSAERIANVIHHLPAGAGYMKGTPSPWSSREMTSFIQGVEAQSHYTPRHGGAGHSNSSG